MIYAKTTATKKIIALKKKIRAIQGGTSASKTISSLLYLIALAQQDKQAKLTSVISESTPHLKRGAMRDFKNIMQAHNYWKDKGWNATDSIYTFETGSKIEFFSADQSSKLRGGRRDRCFMNEANNMSLDAFDQLEVRTKEFIILDWNPTNEFWFYTEVLNKRKDIDYLTLTYKDNEALSPEIIKSIESRKNRKSWWQVYGLGQLGEVEGKIYKDWAIIDEIPHEARLERYGLDFGYSCLSGETMIKTINGDKRIDKIKAGEKVVTRKGYKKVIWAGSKGYKKVYRFDFGFNKRIIMTGDHRVFTNKGWKESLTLFKKETICVLKKPLIIEFTRGIQRASTQIISILRTKKKTEFYTGIFMNTTLGKYLKDILYTILIKIRSIMNQTTLLPCQYQDTQRYTTGKALEEYQKKRWTKSEAGTDLQKATGKREGKSLLKKQGKELKNVLNTEKKLLQQTHIKSFVGANVERKRIQETVKKNIFVRIVEKFLLHPLITKGTLALKNVQISSQILKEKREVFDLMIEDQHEFFANGVLVHNCDPTSIVAIYYYNGGYIIDEITHLKGLSNKQIADIFLNQENKALIVADSAEPKSIDEIKNYGLNIQGAIKGQGSVNQGIQWVQNQRISVTKRSVNTIKAYRNYLWKTDKDDKIINIPDHYLSDQMDAVRYGMSDMRPNIDEDDEDYKLYGDYS